MRSWRKIKFLFAADFLLGCMLAVAQSARPLPQAPAASPVPAVRVNASLPAEVSALSSEALKPDHGAYIFGAPAPETAPDPSVAGAGLEFAAEGAHLDLTRFFADMNRPAAEAGGQSEGVYAGHYSVKGLLWQSLAFTGIEQSYRFSTDYFMRHLIADGPYWHDYMASMEHWDMNRWSDGDDFLVDDIGHPMQGAVSGFIEIQNSPRQRMLRFGKSSEYWHSRFLAMIWATVFSTQQKIGPLGEAGLGDDGGYTYVPNCPAICTSWRPGQTYLNNTGWTDFIMTPAGGTAWMVFEDFLDREVSDRMQNAHPDSIFPLILRGALNPTRTMANFLRWRAPWYRDFQHYPGNPHISPGIHFGEEDAVRRAPRYEIFPHFDAISLPVNTATCTGCKQMLPGFGVGFASRLTHWIDFDSDLDYHSNASPMPSDRAGGDMVMGTFGFRSGLQYAHYAVKVAVRPGFVSYSRAYETTPTAGGPTPDIGRITHFAAALAVNADYDVSRHFALRAVFGNTPVRYRDRYTQFGPGSGSPPYFNWLSQQVFLTNENWAYQTGVVFRF